MKIKSILFILSVFLNIFLIYRFFIAGNTVENSTDSRTAIIVPEKGRELILSEMRTFLEAVKNIHEGIESGDYQKIEKHASGSGMGVEKDVPADLIRSLPLPFKTLGFNTHNKFDQLAKMAKERKSKAEMHQELSSLMNNCTSCHTTYKIVAKN